jgi:hypothetical protein
MPSEDNRFTLWLLTLFFTAFGLMLVVRALVALKEGTPVILIRPAMAITPWFPLVLGSVFLVFGIIGIYKIYKDWNKFPF